MSDQPTHALRFLGGGNRKISAIKLVRELTQLGLAKAKDVVEQQLVFLEGLDHATATAIVTRFVVESESRVALIEEADYRYAFDPRHPLRGDQPLLRLRRHGPTLAWEQGKCGSWTREREASFESADACEQAIADELASWATNGLELAELELDIVRRTSAREPSLEQAIREADDPDETMAVHADWLQRQGDPRGLVAALDLARARAESNEERERLDQAFHHAVTEHRAHLFGPLHAALTVARLTWRGGLVMGIDIDPLVNPDPDRPRPIGDLDLVEDLLALPICACLRSLRVSSAGGGGELLASKLMASDPAMLAGMRELAVMSSYGFEGVLDWSRMPSLERLELVAGMTLAMDLPRLRELDIMLWQIQPAVSSLQHSKLPSLRKLTLCFDVEAFQRGWGEDPMTSKLVEVLSLPLLGSLDTLALRSDGEPWPRWIIQTLIDFAGLRRIARVDLSEVELERDARELLLAARERLPNFVID